MHVHINKLRIFVELVYYEHKFITDKPTSIWRMRSLRSWHFDPTLMFFSLNSLLHTSSTFCWFLGPSMNRRLSQPLRLAASFCVPQNLLEKVLHQFNWKCWINSVHDLEENFQNVAAIFHCILWKLGFATPTPRTVSHHIALEKSIHQSVTHILAVTTVSNRANDLPHVSDLQ